MGFLFEILVQTVNAFFTVYFWLILIRVIASWIRPSGLSPWVAQALRVVHQLTEPVLAPIRERMPQGMMLDFSPLIALFLLGLVQRLLIQLLRTLSF